MYDAVYAFPWSSVSDPLSLYIFVLYLEQLSLLVNRAVATNC